MKTWHAFAFLIVTAIVMYYVKWPILIIAGMIGFFWGVDWLSRRFPRTMRAIAGFLGVDEMSTMPIISLHGTSPKELLQQQMDAMSAISVATHKLQAAAPNARDYQTAPRDAFAAAMNDHLDRVRRLESVQAELDAIAQHLVNSVANSVR